MRRRENSTSEELITGYGRNSWDIKEPWPKTQQAQSEKDRSEGAAGACSVEQMLIVQSITEVSLQPYSAHCATKINSNTTVLFLLDQTCHHSNIQLGVQVRLL